jgi:hypothetical protein
MFVDPYAPQRRMASMRQEAFPNNAAALGRVLELWDRSDFQNPFILEASGEPLWNSVELSRVVSGDDEGAPTPARWKAKAIRALASYFRSMSHLSARGRAIPSAKDEVLLRARIGGLADELDALAADTNVAYRQVEDILTKLRMLGSHATAQLRDDFEDAMKCAR